MIIGPVELDLESRRRVFTVENLFLVIWFILELLMGLKPLYLFVDSRYFLVGYRNERKT
jgi:hypothetical protein